jgi:hypothetical protein
VLVEWETGETTYKPLDMIASDDPVTCAQYARENNLFDIAKWKCFRRIAKSEKELKRMINQSKLTSCQRDPFRKFGVLVPHNHAQAVE